MKQTLEKADMSVQQAYESIILMACEALKSSSSSDARSFALLLEKHVKLEFIAHQKSTASSGLLLDVLRNDASEMIHLAEAVDKLAPYLAWHEAPGEIPSQEFIGRHCHTELIGPDGHSHSNSIRFGFYLQDPNVHYPPHAHEATEIYFIVSGVASWRIAERAWSHESTGCLIKHEPMETHQMKTEGEPLLAMWGWYGDISFDSYHFTNR